MEIPFIGGAYSGRSKYLNDQICENLFPVIDSQDGKSVLSLMGTPGLKEFCNTGVHAEARGRLKWDGCLFAVFGNTLWKITTAGVASNVGTLSTSTGKVYLAGGVTHLCVTDGTYGYYQESGDTSLTLITDSDFPTPSSLCYIDGYFIVTRADTDEIYISASEDASSWDGLDFAAAEESPDDVLLAHAYKRHLIAFGTETIETFFNSGDSSYPFTRVAGAVVPVGLGATGSVASGPEGLFFLDDQFRVRTAQGYDTVIISTEQVEYQIRQYSVKSDAIGFTYSQEGHSFYVLSFPTGRKTWCFDATTGMWHTRASGMEGDRHRANWHQWFAGKNLVGDYNNGKIYELDLSTFTDDGEPIRSIRAAQVVQAGRKTVFHHRLEIDFEPGVGLATGQGLDPQAMLDWSDNGGKTWSNEHWASIGKIGEYNARAVWKKLGKSRNRIYRLAITDPVKRVIVGAHLEARQGIS